MFAMFTRVFNYIDSHPRLILMMAWPVLTALLVGLILIIWKGPWLVVEAIQHQQIAILGWIALGILGVFALNQLAQSTTFFGRLAVRVGMVDVDADMNGGSTRTVTQTNTQTNKIENTATPPQGQTKS